MEQHCAFCNIGPPYSLQLAQINFIRPVPTEKYVSVASVEGFNNSKTLLSLVVHPLCKIDEANIYAIIHWLVLSSSLDWADNFSIFEGARKVASGKILKALELDKLADKLHIKCRATGSRENPGFEFDDDFKDRILLDLRKRRTSNVSTEG